MKLNFGKMHEKEVKKIKRSIDLKIIKQHDSYYKCKNYEILIRDGIYSCTCKYGDFNQGECKHILAVKRMVRIEQT